MEIKKVAVIGSGTMGHGIAQVSAQSGFAVSLNDISKDFLEKAKSKISSSLDRVVKKGKLTEKDKDTVLARIDFNDNLESAVKGADLVVEAIPELLDLKKETFKRLNQLCSPQAILASNTSQYSITEIAATVSDPSRVIGMHWFNPPVMMRLIRGRPRIANCGCRGRRDKILCSQGGEGRSLFARIPRDSSATRVLVALRLECYRLLEEGVATKEDIDKTLRLALGHPMGQFELADFSGLDIEVPICEALTKIYGDRFRPPQNLLTLVRAGRFGRKNGKGWYDY